MELLSAYTEELQDKYWTDFVIYWDIVDNRVKEEVWLKLLKYKNFNALLRMIDLYFQKDLEKKSNNIRSNIIKSRSFHYKQSK